MHRQRGDLHRVRGCSVPAKDYPSRVSRLADYRMTRPPWQRYTGGLLLTLAVIAARLAMNPVWGYYQNRHLVLLPTIMAVAWFGGLGPALLATLLSTLALNHFWTQPRMGLTNPISSDLVLFVLVSIAVSWLIESLRLARARADAATRSREEVLAVVAHDLRNPLSAIRMTSELLRRGELDAQAIRRGVLAIDRAVARMDALIRDLVDATRIELGELALTVRGEPVRALVQQTLDEFAHWRSPRASLSRAIARPMR